jgi:hypothetical protein
MNDNKEQPYSFSDGDSLPETDEEAQKWLIGPDDIHTRALRGLYSVYRAKNMSVQDAVQKVLEKAVEEFVK